MVLLGVGQRMQEGVQSTLPHCCIISGSEKSSSSSSSNSSSSSSSSSHAASHSAIRTLDLNTRGISGTWRSPYMLRAVLRSAVTASCDKPTPSVRWYVINPSPALHCVAAHIRVQTTPSGRPLGWQQPYSTLLGPSIQASTGFSLVTNCGV